MNSCCMQNPDSDLAQKKDEAERLRAAEKFMKVGTGEAFCRDCGYEYKPGKGDPEYPISAGTYFTVLPAPLHFIETLTSHTAAFLSAKGAAPAASVAICGRSRKTQDSDSGILFLRNRSAWCYLLSGEGDGMAAQM